jgi:saccharopine dehydrogenase-like NADP-dependent oxidoreductase
MHPLVATQCLSLGKNLVTTSYVSEEMKKMHTSATAQGLCFLNEVGLDPGLDHASAMRIIDGVKAQGGQVVSFRSVCGGLPAPEVAGQTPFLYKFSWSPRAVFSAMENASTYREGGRVVQVEGSELLRHAQRPFPEEMFSTMRYVCVCRFQAKHKKERKRKAKEKSR